VAAPPYRYRAALTTEFEDRALNADQVSTFLGHAGPNGPISRSRRYQLIAKGSFPRPSYYLASGQPRWLLKDVREWQGAQVAESKERAAALTAHGKKAVASRRDRQPPAASAGEP
jgi:predicted DNA-binding transcriptional regulator AlpA